MQDDVKSRRLARQKKARKKRLITAFVLSLIMTLVILTILCFTVFFPVKNIKVSGSELYTQEQIKNASGLTPDDNLLALSEDEIETNIRKELPYVNEVKIEREFPSTVILTVADAKDFAFYGTKGNYFVISEKGYVLKKQAKKPKNIFQIVTNGIDGEIGEKVVYKKSKEQELVKKIEDSLTKENISINMINVKKASNVELKIENDKFTVKLGKTEYIEEKIAHLSTMIDSIGNRSGTINLEEWTPQERQGRFIEDKS